ncbi:NHL repeat-containing protein 2 [Atheta coriaria]|uniref:NHL repeat-containing protein 2 n=1 Tax=Dalotia coriaria TaxID=877792 RepID=UPI0031F3D67A
MHILPDLKEIEHTFSVEDGLVVIGVHSAKFTNESVADNVKNAVMRYNIEHAVVNDDGAKMWQQCGINCWPSLLLISPEGQPLVLLMGEGHKETLKVYIKHFLAYYKDKLSHKSLPISKTVDSIQHNENLMFPGKIKSFANRLCISDSGNNRLIFIDDYADENIKSNVVIVGSACGEIGMHDGEFTNALFNQPQGVCFLNKDICFVADTENHAIRKIDFTSGTVSTIAGNGVQSNDTDGGKIGTQQGISSPWDLEVFITDERKSVLLIAMAGTHQIWAVFMEDTKWWKGKEYKAGTVVCIAGSGNEENRNNNYPNKAAFAQPSGLALFQQEKMVYIADSESSSVRRLDLRDGKVSGVVGGDKNPNNLFSFGDVDGVSTEGKLQHCLGLARGATARNAHKLFVADTYNHKIKIVDTRKNHVKTVISPKFNEPCGLFQNGDGKLYVADTNNHQIKICTLNEDESEILSVSVFKLDNIELQPLTSDVIVNSDKVYTLPVVNCSNLSNGAFNIHFNVALDDNLHFNEEAPQKWSAKANRGVVMITPEGGKDIQRFSVKCCNLLRNEKETIGNNDEVYVKFQLYTCLGDLCFNKQFIVKIPLRITDDQKKGEDVNVSVVIGRNNVKVSN